LQTYLDSKLTLESGSDDTLSLLEKIRQEPGSHHFFANVVQKVTAAAFMVIPLCLTSNFSAIYLTLKVA